MTCSTFVRRKAEIPVALRGGSCLRCGDNTTTRRAQSHFAHNFRTDPAEAMRAKCRRTGGQG